MITRVIALLYLFLWIGHATSAQSASRVFVVDDQFTTTTLFGYLSLFSDGSRQVPINTLLADSTNQYAFKSVSDEILNVGFNPKQHWIKCRVRNEGSQTKELVFGLDFFHIDAISFYAVDADNTIVYQQEQLSRKTPIASRPIAVRYFAFPVVIKPNQTLTLYCRVFRQKSVLLLPIKLLTKKAFLDHGFSFDFLFLLGIGILLIAFLTSFFLFLATKKWVLLYYGGFVLGYGVALLSLEGVWSHYISSVSWLDENTHLVMVSVGVFAQINFTLEFLQLTERLPKKWIAGIRLFAVLALLAGVYVLVTPFSYANSSLVSSIGFSTEVLVLGLIIVGLIDRKYEATLYLVGFLPFFIVTLWFAASVVVNIPRSWVFYQLGYAVPFAQLAVLGVGLGFKLIREQEQAFVAVSTMRQQLVESIIQTQETERQRIAADLHDDLGGTLATLRRRMTDLRQYLHEPTGVRAFDNLQPLIQKSSADLRRIAHNLMPPEFERIGLQHSLAQLVRSQSLQPTRFTFITSGIEQRMPVEIELNAYRVVSELIQNIGRHAQADRAAVQLIYRDDRLTITVEDDGLGSRAISPVDEPMGIGLKNSNLRAEYIGATLWRDVSERGTLVVLDIPYPPSVYAARTSRPNSAD
ncbi:MAG: hypothetical protein H7Z72_18435 [Bacteroidetes bacterium]|nr:hypothetical protein [Fibrella sp.]